LADGPQLGWGTRENGGTYVTDRLDGRHGRGAQLGEDVLGAVTPATGSGAT
jgi:hypothetical protein